MPAPARTGNRLLLVARFDDDLHSHAALRLRALQRLGCTVSSFDLTAKPGILDRLRGGDLAVRLRRAIEEARPSMVLVIRGEGLTVETVLDLKRSTKTAWTNWYPDDLRSFITVEDGAGAYDYIFAAGTDVVDRIKARLGYTARYLPLACDPSVHRPVQPRSPFRANVVFVGSATARREGHLRELVEFGLAIWGPGWRRSSLRDYCRGEMLSTSDYVRAYSGASVAVNVHREADREPAADEKAVNQRTFEIAAIGVPQVVDFRADLHRSFQDGKDLLVYRSPAQLRILVGAALNDLPVAQKLGEAARRKALTRHTYMHRFSTMLRAFSRGAPDEPSTDIGSEPIWWDPK